MTTQMFSRFKFLARPKCFRPQIFHKSIRTVLTQQLAVPATSYALDHGFTKLPEKAKKWGFGWEVCGPTHGSHIKLEGTKPSLYIAAVHGCLAFVGANVGY